MTFFCNMHKIAMLFFIYKLMANFYHYFVVRKPWCIDCNLGFMQRPCIWRRTCHDWNVCFAICWKRFRRIDLSEIKASHSIFILIFEEHYNWPAEPHCVSFLPHSFIINQNSTLVLQIKFAPFNLFQSGVLSVSPGTQHRLTQRHWSDDFSPKLGNKLFNYYYCC